MAPFVFRSRWRLPVAVDVAFAALADVDAYPDWWPQVRGARRIDAESGHAYVRSLLPWTLDLVLTREVEDSVARVLRVGLAGDLAGWCEWRLHVPASGTGQQWTVADFTEEATVTARAARGLSRAAWVTGPVLRANHEWMMRQGERGLVAHLKDAGGRQSQP